MTPKEYLNQAYRLENRIRALKRRVDTLRELATTVSSPGFEEHYNATRNTDASFIRTLDKIMEYESETDQKMKVLIELREQILSQIDQMESPDEALVLEHRYIYNMPWSDIGRELCVDERTVRRWHNKALAHFVLPEHPIVIEKSPGLSVDVHAM